MNTRCEGCNSITLATTGYCRSCGKSLNPPTQQFSTHTDDVGYELSRTLQAADQAFEGASFVVAARLYAEAFALGLQSRSTLNAKNASRSGFWSGLAASGLTGGLGPEDIILGPLTALLTKRFVQAQQDAALQTLNYIAIRDVISCLNAPQILSSPHVDMRLLHRIFFLMTGVSPFRPDKDAMATSIQNRLADIDMRSPELAELVFLVAKERCWTSLLTLFATLGYRDGEPPHSGAPTNAPPDSPRVSNLMEAYELLGVTEHAPMQEVAFAFEARLKDWTPANIDSLAPALQAMARTRRASLETAFQIIRDARTGPSNSLSAL